MTNLIKSLFTSKQTHIPKGSCYAVLRGDYYGEILAFFHQDGDVLYFVSLPKMEIREVKKSKFEIGIEEKILDPVQKLPKKVYKVIEAHGKNEMRSK